MTRSTTTAKMRKFCSRLWPVLFWLLCWHLLSLRIGQEILLVSPVSVAARLTELVMEGAFWQSIAFSFWRIVAGYLMAVVAGVILAALSARLSFMRSLLMPLLLVVKSIPVASFIILVLIWIPSRNLSVVISFLIVMPIIYTNVLEGILRTDPKMLEMAAVFRIPLHKRLRYIYLSQVMPFFRSACAVSLGLCWKSGIAAEVIGIPKGSIGEHLYQAKVFLNTPDLFAWTVVIILVSLLFERLFLRMLDGVVHAIERS